jgi:hypothetical protein
MFRRGFQAQFAYRSVVGATSASTDSQGSQAKLARQCESPGGTVSKAETKPAERSKGIHMNIRLISASAATALGLMLSTGAEARTFVVYGGPPVVYVPPPRPVYYAVPAQPRYVTVMRAVPVVAVPVPAPRPVVYVPVQHSYAAVPVAYVRYAQPVTMVPVAGMQ